MPNFGLKCFLGSFIFSLLAVMAVTKGYFVLFEDKSQPVIERTASIQNIELYAQNDESDKIYEKFKKISASPQIQLSIDEKSSEDPSEDNTQDVEEEYDDISDTLAFDGEQTGDIIYDPDEETNSSDLQNDKEDTSTKMLTDRDILSEKPEIPEEDSDELQIADAEDAPSFIIPLKHTFSTTTLSGSSVSSETKSDQTALASQDVKSQANLKDDMKDDPWETAIVSNPYITKNKIAEASQKHKDEISALDEDKNQEAKSEEETKVAYKMMKNILIPIPDEIANDENLTPQLSYSAQNKKIDADLKNKQKAKEEQEKLAEKIDDEQSKSLSDSITDWFSQGNSMEKVNVVKEEAPTTKSSLKEESVEQDEEEQDGIFSKLLGLNKKGKGSIIPSELKLSFQPNRAEISGQTLEWLHAFSQNALKDDDVKVEIRIDGSGSYELQQKRLNLLYTIFANNGVNYEKINIIFTARDPNSFIIRNVKYALEDSTKKVEKKKTGPWY